MIRQLYPYQVPRPNPNEIIIFRNKENGKRSYVRWYDNVVTIMQDEEDGETFNIYENNVTSIRNLTEDVMDVLDTDGSYWGNHPNGLYISTVKFRCQSYVGGGSGGGKGSRGFQGVQGVQGPSQGPQGFQGVQGDTGNQGTQGFQGVTGTQGSQGNQGGVGAQGTTGAQGAQGSQGSQGSQGASSGSVVADFYALMPPDNAATVAVGGDVDFPNDGPTTAGALITRTGADTFNLATIGIYQVLFQVSVTEAGQLVITLNGLEIPYTVVGRATGTSQIVGMALIETTTIDNILTIRNPSANSTALTITPLAGGANPVSAHLIIELLS